MSACSKGFHCDDFDAALVIFSSVRYGANACEAAQKITADEKDDHRCSLCVIVCIVLTYQ